MELVQRYIAPVLSPLATVAIVVIVSIFILLQQEDLRDRLIRLFGSRDLHRTTIAMDDAARRLSKYFLTQLAINTSFGIIIGAGLFFIGVPSPILFGVMAALLRFVPYIGAPLAAIFPLALAAAVDPGWSTVLWTLGLFLVVEPIMGQVVEPVLYGHSTGLSPFSVVVAAIFWTWLWGPIGLILSTPLTLCLVVLGRHVDRLEFLDVLLGDRPALTPVESFYQRMLAGDPDEAIDYAELLLKERSLSSYYDEVALKGLQLAAHDVTRGVLAPEQLERIKDAIASLVEDLDDHDDVDPAPDEADDGPAAPPRAERALPVEPAPTAEPPEPDALPEAWRGEGAVLCVAGRGPLDEAAAAMFAQLLTKHGLGARVEPHHAVSRTGIGGARHKRCGDGVHLLPGDHRHAVASALSAAAGAPEGAWRADPGRALAGRGGGAARRPAARGGGRRLLRDLAARRRDRVPGSGARRGRGHPARGVKAASHTSRLPTYRSSSSGLSHCCPV